MSEPLSGARKYPGRLLIFEGPDGVGKSTIVRALAETLEHRGPKPRVLSFPGRDEGTLGKLVYDIHHEPQKLGVTQRICESARQTLHVAAHLDAIERVIAPALEAGEDVILDRFWWSAWVYGIVGGIPVRLLEPLIALEKVGWGLIVPSLAVLVCPDRPFRQETSEVRWQSLREEYDELARRESSEYQVMRIDNTGTVEDSVKSVLDNLDGLVVRRGRKARPRRKPSVVKHLAPLRVTEVYDSYWRFAAERQEIFFRRLEHPNPPWTEDPILREFKFTNCYRASDRVSQYLIRHVIYRDDLPNTATDVVFRTLLFKQFNRIETWELLERKLGPIIHEEFDENRYSRILDKEIEAGRRIYSGAYIMPSGRSSFGHPRKHRNHLALLGRMLTERLPERLQGCRRMQDAFDLLRTYPTIGDFLAYQYAIDLNYSEILNFSEMDFVVPGPGALDGIRKCFSDLAGLREPEVIHLVAKHQEQDFARLGITFKNLWGRRLQLIDCQNLFCEVDKYARVRHPEIPGLSGRSRIKQKYSQQERPMQFWYPPKWELNEKIPASLRATGGGREVE